MLQTFNTYCHKLTAMQNIMTGPLVLDCPSWTVLLSLPVFTIEGTRDRPGTESLDNISTMRTYSIRFYLIILDNMWTNLLFWSLLSLVPRRKGLSSLLALSLLLCDNRLVQFDRLDNNQIGPSNPKGKDQDQGPGKEGKTIYVQGRKGRTEGMDSLTSLLMVPRRECLKWQTC